ncbi:hypothetical protein [Clostridium neonatale]|uniref:Uncharacterized protein n=1 Tax=Clostridium neonatale TaxID=137838 RepID=A0AA86JTN3_9CLOT|nr:hypothetical protein CNEO_60086 [Clostridium neonatale]
MDKEMLEALRAMFKEELKAELEPIKADIKEIKIKWILYMTRRQI